MMRYVCFMAVLVLLPVSAASAAPITDQASCNKRSFEIAEAASKAKLADDEAGKIEDKLAALDGQCAGGKFAEAETTAKEIEAALPKK